VNAVADAVAVVIDAPMMDDQAGASIQAALEAGKFALVVGFGHQEIFGDISQRTWGVDDWEMPVAVVAYLPRPLDDKGYRGRASQIAAAVYAASVPKPGQGSVALGPTWNGNALDTEYMGGGGVYYDDGGRACTDIGLAIRFRTSRGDAAEVFTNP
jgi:hypothetical protein